MSGKEMVLRSPAFYDDFEKYVAEILKHNGYTVRMNKIVSGQCIKDYEIDFIARKGSLTYIGECKYRNRAGDRITSKDVLINQARFEDIKHRMKGNVKSLLVTNTKFTTRARQYAQCKGMELLGWRYPVSAVLKKCGSSLHLRHK